MKKILIISPHFPPSNLTAVHRSRFFAHHLPSFGWKPIILTVDEKYYEESLDHNLEKLLPDGLQIERVKALKVTKPRFIGDIGLRGFINLYRKAKQLIKKEKIDFLYIPIPSFYCSLLGRWLNKTTRVKYGIDYIDPWVHEFAGSNKLFSRHWLSTKISKILEPIAVKNASLITGVAEGYYLDVIKRNPHLSNQAKFVAMPFGNEKTDHEKVKELDIRPYLFQKKTNKIQLVYAGAMLPKAYEILDIIFKIISTNSLDFQCLEIYFIGTGKRANDLSGFNIRPYAEKYGLWGKIIFECPNRISYLDVLVHLNAASGIFILGSTEAHYSPSKVYQGIQSGKPVFAILHKESEVVKIIRDAGAGIVLDFNGEKDLLKIEKSFIPTVKRYFEWMKTYNTSKINYEAFEEYSAKNITKLLAIKLDELYFSQMK